MLISLFFVNTYSSNVVSDSIKIKTFEQHVKSLDYISRKTSNNKLYLNLAKSYCDSILKFDSKNTFDRFIICLYFTFMTLSTVGYGDFCP